MSKSNTIKCKKSMFKRMTCFLLWTPFYIWLIREILYFLNESGIYIGNYKWILIVGVLAFIALSAIASILIEKTKNSKKISLETVNLLLEHKDSVICFMSCANINPLIEKFKKILD